ncbi:radical SAM protein [Pectinatus frisingensis]|uniref:radical SAM protein n=1 Tax=Pectinatus frisingensis TaxID=865 RepID=UPI0018C500F5|nr:radical SAM protein [Pectinatus frisingensis]
MKNIGLIDIDSHAGFPNLALMKLSAWHKKQGDNVYLLNPSDVLNGDALSLPLFVSYDKLYAACVFDWNRKTASVLESFDVEVGGSGYSFDKTLPDYIEKIYPDYSLYNIEDTAYGFLTRGCPRRCRFCIVGLKEGTQSQQVADLNNFWHGQNNIKLLDPNLLACPNRDCLLRQLADSGAWVDFTQGLDIRLMDDFTADYLNNIKIKNLHFAWDDVADTITEEKLKKYAGKFKIYKGHKPSVYVLTNFNSSQEQNLYRIYTLRDMGYDPYIMIYDKVNAPKHVRYLQRWVNNKKIFRTIDWFEDYDHKVG